MIRFSIISLISLFLLSSCALPTTKGFTKVALTETQFNNIYFADIKTDYIYKAKINAFDNFFGGLLIIKKIKENNHRIVFTTDFGNKIFDFEIIDNTFKTHYILEQLNKGIIVNTLKNDFQTLTKEYNNIQNVYKDQTVYMYQSKLNNRFNHYVINAQTKALQKIIHTTKTKEKTIISFSNIKNSIANKINIKHQSQAITIDLFYLNE